MFTRFSLLLQAINVGVYYYFLIVLNGLLIANLFPVTIENWPKILVGVVVSLVFFDLCVGVIFANWFTGFSHSSGNCTLFINSQFHSFFVTFISCNFFGEISQFQLYVICTDEISASSVCSFVGWKSISYSYLYNLASKRNSFGPFMSHNSNF